MMRNTILVIDDEESVRKSFTLALEDSGYGVDTAESGEKGIKMLQNKRYGIIFLDLKMPGMDGVETLKKIREKDKDTPVYVVTAFHEEFFSKLQKLTKAGIKYEITDKPLDSDMILLITRGVIEGPQVY
ncbi:MAG: response regulator [Planctomycetes bacterium]|nr:response regulator [Planctomycetota bacterium]